MDRRDPTPETDALLAAFAGWAAAERAADAARSRGRERWLRQQAGEEATLAGILVDLAERAEAVVVVTTSRQYLGRVAGVARDFCVLVDRAGATVFVVAARISVLRPQPGTHATPSGPAGPDRRGGRPRWEPSGDRPAPLDLAFADALGILAADRSPVRLDLAGGDAVTGDLEIVGTDLVTVRLPVVHRPRVHVTLAAIEACGLS